MWCHRYSIYVNAPLDYNIYILCCILNSYTPESTFIWFTHLLHLASNKISSIFLMISSMSDFCFCFHVSSRIEPHSFFTSEQWKCQYNMSNSFINTKLKHLPILYCTKLYGHSNFILLDCRVISEIIHKVPIYTIKSSKCILSITHMSVELEQGNIVNLE